MKSSRTDHILKILSLKQSEQRRCQLENGFMHLMDKDNGEQDVNPAQGEFALAQPYLNQDGYESVQVLKGKISGGLKAGHLEFTRKQTGTFDDDRDERWSVDYEADGIHCERWRGEEGSNDSYHSIEFISRKPEVDSYQIEWKIAGG